MTSVDFSPVPDGHAAAIASSTSRVAIEAASGRKRRAGLAGGDPTSHLGGLEVQGLVRDRLLVVPQTRSVQWP